MRSGTHTPGLLLGLVAVLCVGCGPRHVPLPGDYYQADDKKVAVVVIEPGFANLYKVGRQGLLDMAISDATTQPLQERLLHLAASNVMLYAATSFFEAGLDARGLDAAAANATLTAADLPSFPDGDDVTFGRLDIKQIASATGADQVLVLDTRMWGLTRKYYGFVALGPPKGYAKIQGLLLDGDDNRVLWRLVAEGEAEIQGDWNEPAEYPDAVRAVSAGLTAACQQLSADLRLAQPDVDADLMAELVAAPQGAFAEQALPTPDLGETPTEVGVPDRGRTHVTSARQRPPEGPPVQFAVGPLVAPLAGNDFNDDFAVGFNAGVRLNERLVIEAQFLGFVMGVPGNPDENNQTSLANAVNVLTDPHYTEMFEPTVSLVGRVRGTPFRGTIPGTPVGVALDLLAGGGFLDGEVELGGYDWDSMQVLAMERFDLDPLPAVNYGLSLKLLPHPSVAIHLDLQALTSFDQILDWNDPDAAQTNRSLRADNPLLNRLDCNGEGRCKAAAETITMLGFGVDFYLPAQGGAR